MVQKKQPEEKESEHEDSKSKSAIDQIFNKITSFGKGSKETFGEFRQTPLMDLIECKNEIILKADLPGVVKKDVTLEVQDRLLTIRAECLTDVEDGTYIHRERFYRKYEGSINIPIPINEEKATAKLSNGVLTVYLPKKIDSIRVDE